MLSHERLPDECGELRVRSRFSGRIVGNPEVRAEQRVVQGAPG
jgi:hypothetical protein